MRYAVIQFQKSRFAGKIRQVAIYHWYSDRLSAEYMLEVLENWGVPVGFAIEMDTLGDEGERE